MASPKYRYAVAVNVEDYQVMRLRDDEKVWEVLATLEGKDKAMDMAEDLNFAQRMKPAELEQGQEIRKK